jgi:4-hydroxy-2-oxoglutarate aldolase
MNLRGVFAPVPTPFDERDQVDIARLRIAFERWVAGPLTGFVVLGSTGEAALLDDDEADRAVDEARQAVPRGRLLIVGTGRESTKATVRATRRAAELGADAVLVRTPGFFKAQMTTDVFLRHYRTVADASPVPVLLYNFTAVTGVNLLPAAAEQLAGHSNIIGMKESGNDVAKIADLVAVAPPGFSVLAGSATTFFAALSVGATGGILALACLLPRACVRLFDLMQQRRHDEARELQQALLPISRLVGSLHGVPGLKAAMQHLGCDVGVPRPPLLRVGEGVVAELKRTLDGLTNVPAVEPDLIPVHEHGASTRH